MIGNFSAIQFILIGLGLFLQAAAFTALRRDISSYHGRGTPPTSHDHDTFDLGKSRPRRSTHTWTTRVTKDYYEMEKTPTGISPANLAKTAKVKYFQDGKLPPA